MLDTNEILKLATDLYLEGEISRSQLDSLKQIENSVSLAIELARFLP